MHNWLAANRHDAMLGLSAQPVSEAESILRPSQDRLRLETPPSEKIERLAHVAIWRPQPQDAAVMCNRLHIEGAYLLDRHCWIRTRAAQRWVSRAHPVLPWRIDHDDSI